MTVEQPDDRPIEPRADDRTLELREEELLVRREMREVGEAEIRTRVEEVPARLEVEAYAEEVEVEHVPVGEIVSQRRDPYEDGDVLVVPVYEEQLVVTKRLVLREQLRIRRVRTTQRQLFEDTLRREHADIGDPANTGLVHERYPTGRAEGEQVGDEADGREEGGLVNLVRRALQ
jgi:uncharacterized protein (TIGR02271 family)